MMKLERKKLRSDKGLNRVPLELNSVQRFNRSAWGCIKVNEYNRGSHTGAVSLPKTHTKLNFLGLF